MKIIDVGKSLWLKCVSFPDFVIHVSERDIFVYSNRSWLCNQNGLPNSTCARITGITTVMGAVMAHGCEPMMVMEYMENGSL